MLSVTEGRKTRKRVSFGPEEDDRLRELVLKFGENNWRRIASKMPKRDRRQCRERWFNYLTPFVTNGPWTPAEEVLLRAKVADHGRSWKAIQPFFPGRTDINIKNHWKRLQKADLRLSRPGLKTEGGDDFDGFVCSILGREGDISKGQDGRDPFEFGLFW
jgi:hypothetical protein